jgi:type IV pilus biogenesis protein CpaD/CtpE
MLKKTLAVAALACLLAGCASHDRPPVGNPPVSSDQPHEQPDCPKRDDATTACR